MGRVSAAVVTCLCVAGLIAFGVLRVDSLLTRLSRAQQVAEALRLKADNLEVAEQLAQHDLQEALSDMAALKQQLEQAKKAAPDAKVVQTISATTAPQASAAKPEAGGCVVSTSDQLSVKVEEAELKTKNNNYILLGVAKALRIDSAGVTTELLSAPFESSTSIKIAADTVQHALGWGVGPWAGITTRGTVYGLQVSPPPLVVFGFSLELVGSAAIGTAGVQAAGGLLVRH